MIEINNLINNLGWTILNSLWQGLFILIVLSIALTLIGSKYSKIRAFLAYASLIIIFAASIRTFSDLNFNQPLSSISAKTTDITLNSNFILFHENLAAAEKNANTSNAIWDGIISSISNFGGNNLEYIVFLWVIGLIIVSIRLLGGYAYIQRLKRKEIYPAAKKWVNIINSISGKLKITKPVQLFESGLVKFPTVIGHFKPVILMPIGMLSGIPITQIEMILAHELAHIKRADYILNLIQSVLETLYFFNPSVWLISKFIRTEREYACDDLAISINNNSTLLANALLNIHQRESSRPNIALSALGTKNSLFGRIKRMIRKNDSQSAYPKKLAMSAALISCLIVLSILACSSSIDNVNSEKPTSQANLSYNIAPDDKSQSQTEINNLHQEIETIESQDNIEPVVLINKVNDDDDRRKFNFHKDGTYWKGIVEDGKLIQLFKNGEEVTKNDLVKHEDFVIDTLNEIDRELEDFEFDMEEFKEEMANLKEELKDLKVDIDLNHIHEIEHHLNSKEFQNNMEELKRNLHEMKFEFNHDWKKELKEALKNTKDWKVNFKHFQSDEFKEEMKNLKNELKNFHDLDLDMEFNFDDESFEESMKELQENIHNLKINLSDMDIDLSDLKIDLKDLKVEMKKLRSFMKEMRLDLVEEGFIENKNDDFDLELSKEELVLNDTKLPIHLHKRYLAMYEEHFGKELEENFRINN